MSDQLKDITYSNLLLIKYLLIQKLLVLHRTSKVDNGFEQKDIV